MMRLREELDVEALIARYATGASTAESEGNAVVGASHRLAAMALAATVGTFAMSPYAFADTIEPEDETAPPAILETSADSDAASSEAADSAKDIPEVLADTVQAPAYVLLEGNEGPDSIVLFAEKYALTFEYGLDHSKLIQRACEAGTVIEWPSKWEVAVSGYELVGWCLDRVGSSEALVADANGQPPAGMSAAVMPAEGITYKAIYQPVQTKFDVTVSVAIPTGARQPNGSAFPTNGTLPNGKAATSTFQIVNGQKLSASDIPEIPEVLGYEFDGWYLVNGTSGQAQKVTPTDVTVTKNITFEARYTEVGTAQVEFVWGKGIAESGSAEGASRWSSTLTKGHKLTATLPNATIDDGKTWKFLGWYDKGGKAFNANTAVTANQVYTARYEYIGPTVPVGPVDPNPINPDPIDPDPVDPKPIVPDPSEAIKPGPVVSEGDNAGVIPIGSSSRPRIPAPATPWNPPGLALAAGFTIPENGPGVIVLDESGEPVVLEADEGNIDKDLAASAASAFDAVQPTSSGLPFSMAEAAVAIAATGGVALAALVVTRTTMFMAANAQATRLRRRKALGLK